MTKHFLAEDLSRLQRLARESKRLRANQNFHPEATDPIQRFFNALEPYSYIRPHRHVDPPNWELLLLVRGAGAVLLFDERGKVDRILELDSASGNLAVEIPPEIWHTLVARQSGTVFFELKPGPYAPFSDKDFAPWSAPEGTERADRLGLWFRQASPGEQPPQMPDEPAQTAFPSS